MRIGILIFIYTKHFAYLKVYTKFHNPKASSCWENFDEKCTHAYIGTTEGKMSFSIFIFIHTIHLAYPKVYEGGIKIMQPMMLNDN